MRKSGLALAALSACVAVAACVGLSSAASPRDAQGAGDRPGAGAVVPVVIVEPAGIDRPGEWILGGVPVQRGLLRAGGAFELKAGDGRSFPIHAAPAAWWPDGSVKWLHVCGTADLAGGQRNEFTLDLSAPIAPAAAGLATVRTAGGAVRITGGVLDVELAGDADGLLMVRSGGQELLKAPGLSGRMVLAGPDGQNRREYSLSFPQARVEVVVQTPERVVVRLDGVFAGGEGEVLAEMLLFVEVMRQTPEIRLQPVWIYLGRPQDDLVESLTVTAHRPLQADQAVYAFANERGSGYWDEIVPVRNEYGDGPRWPMARQVQLGSSFYLTEKRTFAQDAAWLKILEGQRSQGWCYLGDRSWGLTAAMRYFWQEYPGSLAIDCDAGTVTFGLVPPEARALDLRRYSPIVYGGVVYEYSPAEYTDDHGARGKAKAFELMLRFSPGSADLEPPSIFVRLPRGPDGIEARQQRQQQAERRAAARRQVARHALAFTSPARVMVDGQYLAASGALGRLAAPRAGVMPSTEAGLVSIMDFIAAERRYRGWYGRMDFGDAMTSFNADKDMWAYDDGGHAWINTESLPDYGLWISALRSARADWLELAIEMSRHNRDVDVYHRGPFKAFGSRHGVNHWSCGDKEWRIGMPLVRRLHYYTTADPWTLQCIMETAEVYQSYVRTARTAPNLSSAFATILTKYEITHDPRDAETLRNFADLYASAFDDDGALMTAMHVDLSTGVGEVTDRTPHPSMFFFHLFGGQHALVDYAELTGHEALTAALVRHARSIVSQPRGPRIANLYHLAFAHRQTGEQQFLDAIGAALRGWRFSTQAFGGDDPLDEPPHQGLYGNRGKQMCHNLGDPLHLAPFGLVELPPDGPDVTAP